VYRKANDFCDLISKLKRPPIEWKKIFAKKNFKRRNSNGQKSHGKKLTISSDKGNENQNHTKIPTHSC
jgi:hypothetical protein